MFGITFITIAHKIDNQRIKGYMTLTAYGFILLYISSQVITGGIFLSTIRNHDSIIFGIIILSIINRIVLYRSIIIPTCTITKVD